MSMYIHDWFDFIVNVLWEWCIKRTYSVVDLWFSHAFPFDGNIHFLMKNYFFLKLESSLIIFFKEKTK